MTRNNIPIWLEWNVGNESNSNFASCSGLIFLLIYMRPGDAETLVSRFRFVCGEKLLTQNKEGILPVATPSIALYVRRRSRLASDVASVRGGNFVIGFININK